MSHILKPNEQPEPVKYIFTFKYRAKGSQQGKNITESESIEVNGSELERWVITGFGKQLFNDNFAKDKHGNRYELEQMMFKKLILKPVQNLHPLVRPGA